MNEWLRRARIHAGLTQEEFAKVLDVSSVSIHRWERQGMKPNTFHRQLICEYLHLPETTFWPQEYSDERTLQRATVPIIDISVPMHSPNTTLVGQQALFKQLQQQLESPSPKQILSLIGWPGQGKTAVLHMLATHPELRTTFDGVFWATVGQESQPLQHLQRWGRLLGLSTLPKNPEQARDRLRMAIGSRRILFLLDDLWENDLFAYLVGGTQCQYVFTTRQKKLALSQSHTIYRVPDLNNTEAFTLLIRSLPPTLVQKYRQHMENLMQHVSKLPLALVLLGEYLRCEARASSPRRFEEALFRLTQDAFYLNIPCSMRIHAHQPCSLYAAISSSIQRLPPLPKKALSLLVHALPMPTAPFTEQQVMALHQPGLQIHLLDSLVDTGLLEWRKNGSYWLHPVVTAYARVFLSEEHEQEYRAG
ncbi:MAG: NB-ARC domain-containing protein [Ktedonobacteraceae bacterium]